MRILHLTDFHYDQKKHSLLETLKPKLLETLKYEKVDYVIFSGDLVSTPKSIDDFKKAKEYLITPILDVLGLTLDSFFICQGNHDVQRDQELPAITEAFAKFRKSEDLEGFISVQNGAQLTASLLNHKLYFQFIKEDIKFKDGDIINELFTIHRRQLVDNNLCFVTINSSWRSSSSEKDSSNLFYPISKLSEIVSQLDKNDINIFIMHHPLREFKHFISREMEDLIFDNFHVMLTGHLHKKAQSLHYANDIGIFCCASQATFNKNTEGIELGFSIVDFESKFFEIKLHNFFYNESDNKFYKKEVIDCSLPLHGEKEEQNKLRKTFKKRFAEIRLRADGLFLLPDDENSSFMDLFVDPVILDKPRTQLKGNYEEFNVKKIEQDNKNYLIFGRDKSGKTSLLYKLQLDLLDNFTDEKVIPFYIDFKTHKNISENIDLIKMVMLFCESNSTKIQNLCSTYKVKLLIDNYRADNKAFNESVLKLIGFCKNISIVATLEETLIAGYQNYSLNNHVFDTLFIHDISRTEIRKLTYKWPTLSEDKKEETIERISKIFAQLNLPYNYWTVSLFLWITKTMSDTNFHNNFDLIQLYVDGILSRKLHSIDRSIKISYDDLKEYLSELAYTLVKEHHVNDHSISFDELVITTSKYRNNNSKIVIETEDLIQLILDRGVIKKTDGGRYSFRLNGVFEFFIAYYMKDNRKFTFDLVNDNSLYLSFANEFELYAGFNRKDKDFLEAIYNKSVLLFETTVSRYKSEGEIDENLARRIQNIDVVTKELANQSKKESFVLTHKQQDDLLNEISKGVNSHSEVVKKQAIEKIEDKSEHLEKVLFILCRVFRNSNINSPDLDKKILDYIIDTSCNLGFLLVDETKEEILVDGEISHQEKALIKLVMEMLPIIVQTYLFDALAQNNLERLLEDKLQEFRKDLKKNQFKLFLIYYLLIDLDFKNQKKLIPQLIEDMKLGVLRHSNILKFHLYLAFKATGKKDLMAELEGHIRTQEKIIDSKKSHLEEVNKNIESTKKIGIVRRNK